MLFPSLTALRCHLRVTPVNTGRRLEMFGPQGLISNDMEGLHALIDAHGRLVLQSGVEFPLHMYRGQTKDYGTCTPSLARLTKHSDQLLAMCRRVAFEEVISEHPLVQLAERITFFDVPLYVDREGLAQHYGHATDMLDITSNFDVATFFATCTWNPDNNRYEPFAEPSNSGVIYRVMPMLLSDLTFQQGQTDVPLRIVGWQPLTRPEQQRACAIQLQAGCDFEQLPTVEKFYFSHDPVTSHGIWKAFDGGWALFPPDAAAELSLRADRLSEFTDEQLVTAWIRLTAWSQTEFSARKKIEIQQQAGIEKIPAPVLTWDGLLSTDAPEKWQATLKNVLDRVRYRRAMWP